MVSLFFLVILSLPIFLLFLLKKNTTTKTSRLPPGPRGLPLIGNLHQLDSCNLQKHLWQLSQKYGPLFTLRLGSRRTLVACSAKMAKEILKTHDLEFCSRPVLTGLKAVVKETMRLQPTAPLLIPRETTEKCNIDGYEIPAKTLVYVNAWAIGRDSEAWENPNEFNPDRFLGSSIDFKGQDFELIPFGSGRRICPGLDMGIATVELSLANLLHKFDWEMPGGMRREDIDIDHVLPGITAHRRVALCLVPKPYAVMGNKDYQFS